MNKHDAIVSIAVYLGVAFLAASCDYTARTWPQLILRALCWPPRLGHYLIVEEWRGIRRAWRTARGEEEQ